MNTVEQVAWAAGRYDGEGSCSWTAKNHECQEAMVKQKHREILDALSSYFGGSVSPVCGQNKLGALGWRWRLFGANARNFLSTIYPMLSTRRKWQVARIGVFDDLQIGVS